MRKVKWTSAIMAVPHAMRLVICFSAFSLIFPFVPVELQMLEAHSHVISKQKGITSHFLLVWIFHFDIWTGKKHELDRTSIETGSSFSDPFAILREMVEAPADTQDEFTRIKKDIFHAFHMIPIPVNHGHCAGFLHSLQDHLTCWDPVIWGVVGKLAKVSLGWLLLRCSFVILIT